MALRSSLRPSNISHENIRRRSGGYSTHDIDSEPSTVRLVPSNSARTGSLHRDTGDENRKSRSDSLESHDEYMEEDVENFTHILLTPRPSLRTPPRLSERHTQSPAYESGSSGYRQNSPPPSSRRVLSESSRHNLRVSRGFFTLSTSSLFPGYSAPRQTPASIRTDSESTLRTDSGPSCDSSHKRLIPSISKTIDKFTNKWPRPQSMKKMDLKRTGRNWRQRRGIETIRETVSELEEGYTLGLDKIDRWTRFKWCLMISVVTVLCYGSASMICAILTWFRTWDHADVMYVSDNDILILITLASSILMFTGLLGLTGTLLNSRPILATYTLLLWPALISMLAIGYSSYKRYAFSLDHKLNFAWSQYYTPLGRLMIQSSLRCCGYYNPLHEATISNKCYPRTPLPGCKGKLYRFEKGNLYLIWSTTFSVVPLHLINIVVALLCSNHVTRRFGKGITPKQYRLSELDLKTDVEKISAEMEKMRVERVSRPEFSRASSSTLFREDREEKVPFMNRDYR